MDGEGVVLGGDGELLLGLPGYKACLQQSILGADLAGIVQKLLPLGRDRDAPVRAAEQGKADLILQFFHRTGKGGLGDVQMLGGCIERAAVGNPKDIL